MSTELDTDTLREGDEKAHSSDSDDECDGSARETPGTLMTSVVPPSFNPYKDYDSVHQALPSLTGSLLQEWVWKEYRSVEEQVLRPWYLDESRRHRTFFRHPLNERKQDSTIAQYPVMKPTSTFVATHDLA